MKKEKVIEIMNYEINREEKIIKLLEFKGNEFSSFHKEKLEAFKEVLDNYKKGGCEPK